LIANQLAILAQNSNHHEKSIFTTAVYAPLEAALAFERHGSLLTFWRFTNRIIIIIIIIIIDNWGQWGGKQGMWGLQVRAVAMRISWRV